MKKIKTWVARYLPSEIIGTITAIALGVLVHTLTGNEVLTAYAGTWGENIGFYSTIIVRDVTHSISSHKTDQITYGMRSLLKDIRNIILEFGPSEILDSFVIRPFMMYIFPTILHDIPLGILVGKLASDGIFYICTIASYELTRRK